MERSEEEQAEAIEVAALIRRLDEWDFDERTGASAIGGRRTRSGTTFVIRIDPWTPELAEDIARVAEPTRVTVEPFDD